MSDFSDAALVVFLSEVANEIRDLRERERERIDAAAHYFDIIECGYNYCELMYSSDLHDF